MIWSKSLSIRKMLILSGWTELQQWRNCLIHHGGVCKLECLLSKSDVFLYAEKMWRLPLPDPSCAPELFWLLPCGDGSVLGDVSALTGGRLGHHTPRGGISLEKVTCNFKVLISQQGQRGEKHHKDEGAALESLDSTEGDNLLFKYIWKKRTFCPHTPAPGKPLRFSSLWKYFVFDFRTPAQFSKAK